MKLLADLLPKKAIWADKMLVFGFLFILAFIPFHAFLTTWFSTGLGYYEWLKVWKEALMVILLIPAGYLISTNESLRKTLLSRRVNVLIIVFSLWHILLWMYFQPELDAAAIGVVMNLRFLGFFLFAQVIAERAKIHELRRLSLQIVLIGGAIVALFAALQVSVLPNDVLSNFGYGEETIEPYLLIDENEDYVRINSFLRGPNPLGAYAAMIITLSATLYIAIRKSWLIGLATLSIAGSVGSFSRSAWLGLIAALGVLAFVLIRNTKYYNTFLISMTVLVVIGAIGLYVQRDSDFVNYVLLHSDQEEALTASSNSERYYSLDKSINEVASEPFGQGPGTAGPASFFADKLRLSENYYLQIAQEIGWIGLGLFIAIITSTLFKLWELRKNYVVLGLFCVGIGVSFIGIFQHVWVDESLAFVWWGLAGLYVSGKKLKLVE